jgi:hypothetical protein
MEGWGEVSNALMLNLYSEFIVYMAHMQQVVHIRPSSRDH